MSDEPLGQLVGEHLGGRRGSRRAGARSATSATSGVERALDQAAPGELVDADRDVQRHASSWARAACGVPVGRYIDEPGARAAAHSSSRPLAARVASSHCLVPAVWQHEDVVGVGVHREALGAGRGEVGVGLARVAELELELADQVDERRELAVQPLEDDGRAAVERARAPCAASTSPVSGSAGDGGALAV